MAVNNTISFTDKAAIFSAAAAYGINQKVISTWNPYLIRTPRVLVPIQVDALVVRPNQPAESWADCALKAAPQQNCPRLAPPEFIFTGHYPMHSHTALRKARLPLFLLHPTAGSFCECIPRRTTDFARR